MISPYCPAIRHCLAALYDVNNGVLSSERIIEVTKEAMPQAYQELELMERAVHELIRINKKDRTIYIVILAIVTGVLLWSMI